MAKLNVLQEGRDQGMAFAYQIALRAQREGKDPPRRSMMNCTSGASVT